MSYQRYKIPSEKKTPEKMNINLLYITQALNDRNWKSVVHTHHFTELFYVVSGEGNFIVENEKFTVKTDDLIIVNPNVSHTEFGDGRTNLEYIVLGIENLQFQLEGTDTKYTYNMHNFHNCKEDILYYLQKLLAEVKDKEENYEAVCHNLLECLVYFLTRKTKDSLSFEATKKTIRECRFIEEYLMEHFSEDITLQTLSDMTYMNKYYLVHAFKEYKGVSPINYLIERRIQEAQYLLETSNYSIARIAHAVGFSSQSYFAQVFRKEKGVSPKQYRKNFEQAKSIE